MPTNTPGAPWSPVPIPPQAEAREGYARIRMTLSSAMLNGHGIGHGGMIFALAEERTRQGFSHIQPVAETVLAKVQEYAKRESVARSCRTTRDNK